MLRLIRALPVTARSVTVSSSPLKYPLPRVFTSQFSVKSTIVMSEQQAAAAAQQPGQEGPSKSALKKAAKEAEKAKKKAEREQKELEAKQAKEAKEAAEDFAKENYGKLPLNQSQDVTGIKRAKINEINANKDGENVVFRARIHKSRSQGAKMLFFVFRQQDNTIQGLLSVDADTVSRPMVKWAESLPRETLVLVHGVVQQPAEPIKSTSVHDAEIKVTKLKVIAGLTESEPFQLEDASRPAADFEKEDAQFVRVELPTRLRNRVFDLRTPTNQAIFKITSGVGNLFRTYLDGQGFVEIHSPKLQGAATESGASVFKVDYFKRPAFLAQSPQLAKQMCIAADMERVYEIGPVFRAEDSNTHRHMTEFTGLDLEMTFEETYHEVIEVLDGMLLSILRGLKTRFAREIEVIREQFPAQEFLIPEKPVRLTFAQGIQLLKEAGQDVDEYEDIDTAQEKLLGKLVREKYKTDYYLMDKFPSSARPFYTMPDAKNPKLSNSYDFYMRGEEILSGGQRIHDAELLKERMRGFGIDPASMAEYVSGFALGAPPHAGGGIGLERVVMLFLGLGNIRYASLFPRDPRSFPTKAMEDAEASTDQKQE